MNPSHTLQVPKTNDVYQPEYFPIIRKSFKRKKETDKKEKNQFNSPMTLKIENVPSLPVINRTNDIIQNTDANVNFNLQVKPPSHSTNLLRKSLSLDRTYTPKFYKEMYGYPKNLDLANHLEHRQQNYQLFDGDNDDDDDFNFTNMNVNISIEVPTPKRNNSATGIKNRNTPSVLFPKVHVNIIDSNSNSGQNTPRNNRLPTIQEPKNLKNSVNSIAARNLTGQKLGTQLGPANPASSTNFEHLYKNKSHHFENRKTHNIWRRHHELQKQRLIELNEPKPDNIAYIPYYAKESWRKIPITDINSGSINTTVTGETTAITGKPKIRNLREDVGSNGYFNNQNLLINKKLDELDKYHALQNKIRKGTISFNNKKKAKLRKVAKFDRDQLF